VGIEVVSGMAGTREKMVIKYGIREIRSEEHWFIRLVIRHNQETRETTPFNLFICAKNIFILAKLFLNDGDSVMVNRNVHQNLEVHTYLEVELLSKAALHRMWEYVHGRSWNSLILAPYISV